MIDLEFANRVIKTTLITTVLVALFSVYYYNNSFAGGLVIGSLWNIINFWLIKRLMVLWLIPKPGHKGKLIVLMLIKFPVLYGLGFIILNTRWFTAMSILCGFSLLFAVILLKALSILILSKESEKGSIQ